MKDIWLKYSLILLVALFIEFLFHQSPINLPVDFFHSRIRITGILLCGIILTTLIFSHKNLLKRQPDITISKLTFIGFLICFTSESIFQIIRNSFFIDDTFHGKIIIFAHGVIGMSLFGAILSFFIAFQLKTKKTTRLILFIVCFIFIANLIKQVYPAL